MPDLDHRFPWWKRKELCVPAGLLLACVAIPFVLSLLSANWFSDSSFANFSRAGDFWSGHLSLLGVALLTTSILLQRRAVQDASSAAIIELQHASLQFFMTQLQQASKTLPYIIVPDSEWKESGNDLEVPKEDCIEVCNGLSGELYKALERWKESIDRDKKNHLIDNSHNELIFIELEAVERLVSLHGVISDYGKMIADYEKRFKVGDPNADFRKTLKGVCDFWCPPSLNLLAEAQYMAFDAFDRDIVEGRKSGADRSGVEGSFLVKNHKWLLLTKHGEHGEHGVTVLKYDPYNPRREFFESIESFLRKHIRT